MADPRSQRKRRGAINELTTIQQKGNVWLKEGPVRLAEKLDIS